MSERRKVLMLGSGINQAFDGDSWNSFIKKLAEDNSVILEEKSNTPMTFKAIIATKDNIKDSIENNIDIFKGNLTCIEHMKTLQELLSLGFDDILTTNYSYEIEFAASGCSCLTDEQIKALVRHTGHRRAETKYLLHTFNEISFNGKITRIWHIHGECLKKNSMMVGHYWYGGLLSRIYEELRKKGAEYLFKQAYNTEISYDSWIDSFLLGDIYILGLGFGFSEIDLWWLLNRRNREQARKGKALFYSPCKEDGDKIALLKMFGVETDKRLGYGDPPISVEDKKAYFRAFYSDAIEDIRHEINKKE